MTLVIIGPVTKDLIIIEDDKTEKVGGANYYQSFVFEKFYPDYLLIVNASDESLTDDFPDKDKIHVIKKEDTHFFINHYPDRNNRDIRKQLSNFANIPILKSDLEDIMPSDVDAFVLNPLNRYDFPLETFEYLKSFDVPIFLSIQGLLRVPDIKVNENYTIKLDNFDELTHILSNVNTIFLDEAEKNIIGTDHDIDEMVITNGSQGSRIITNTETKIKPVKCNHIIDTTGCGDTYMAAYITQKLQSKTIKESGNFASQIATQKLQKPTHL
ncbi:MAG: ribokinase [Methanobrevibacter thaueri]|nr:ribokinase [Methanobrevibacter thaueri]